MKKLLSLVCVFAMLLTTAGCGASEKKFTAEEQQQQKEPGVPLLF